MDALGTLTELGIVAILGTVIVVILALVITYYVGKHSGKVEERTRAQNLIVEPKRTSTKYAKRPFWEL